MSTQEFDLGKDAEQIAMFMDRRSVKDILVTYVKEILGKREVPSQSVVDPLQELVSPEESR